MHNKTTQEKRYLFAREIARLLKDTNIIVTLLGDNRNSQILARRFEYATYDELSNEFGVTYERIRQIVAKQSRYLRKHMQRVSSVISDNDLLKAQNKHLLEVIRIGKYTEDKNNKLGLVKDESITEMTISCRAYNCLRGAEIWTLSELVAHNVDSIMKFRNIGKKSKTELEDYLKGKGLIFGGKYEFY